MKYRITHPDELNWCIEEWQDSGQVISKGKFKGQLTKGGWKLPKEYHPTLEAAALSLLNKAMGDEVLINETKSYLEAIKLAQSKVLEVLAQMKDT